jgi:hypothetical protein
VRQRGGVGDHTFTTTLLTTANYTELFVNGLQSRSKAIHQSTKFGFANSLKMIFQGEQKPVKMQIIISLMAWFDPEIKI